MSAQQQPQTTESPTAFSGPDGDLTARLAAPVSPTTEKSSAEARRNTSEWTPKPLTQRTFSFDREEHKHAMMAASGALSHAAGVGAGGSGPQAHGFTERA